jgi:hypothetical protein
LNGRLETLEPMQKKIAFSQRDRDDRNVLINLFYTKNNLEILITILVWDKINIKSVEIRVIRVIRGLFNNAL